MTINPVEKRKTLIGLTVMVILIAAAWANSFQGVFLYDDGRVITENPQIRALWPLSVSRPLTRFTFALNYAVHGFDVRGFHAVNLILHLATAFLLFFLIRGSLLRLKEKQFAVDIALLSVMLWALHPLQTESVTYIVQRSEILVSLFYAGLLLCLLKSAQEPEKQNTWLVCGWFACFLGMMSKEVMATAPLCALLFDRVILAQSWSEVFQKRGKFYAALCLTWLPLGYLLSQTKGIHLSAGIGLEGVSPWNYLLTQAEVIPFYLYLSFYPLSLCLDYSWKIVSGAGDVWPYLPVMVAAVLLCIWGIAKARRWAFLIAAFFLVLAPSSSLMPVKDAAVEHRMYLPLICVTLAVVLLLFKLLGQGRQKLIYGLVLIASMGLAVLTIQRNNLYADEFAMWQDVMTKRPENARAHYNLGNEWRNRQNSDKAMLHFKEAIKLKPDYAHAHNNLGVLYFHAGDLDQAMRHYELALKFDPLYLDAYNNSAAVLSRQGKYDEALQYYERALELYPQYEIARQNIASLKEFMKERAG